MSIRLVTEGTFGAKIKVVGVGGAGGNAINNMIEKGLEGVDFIACNTDMQDLEKNKAEFKIQIGRNTTLGLGAGMDDSKGAKAVEESREEIEQSVRGCDMVFITAGTGISARAALLHARGELRMGERIAIESIVDSVMEVKVAGLTTYGPHKAIIPEITGSAFFTGMSSFYIDPDDPFREGFILR